MRKWTAVLMVSVVATLTFITIPRYPYLIDDALSEKAVLSYAHEHEFQYGKDIVFTYGPLGFLVSRYFFGHAAGVRMAVDFLTCFATALGVASLAWHSTGNLLGCRSSQCQENPNSTIVQHRADEQACGFPLPTGRGEG